MAANDSAHQWFYADTTVASPGISHQCIRPLNAVAVVGFVRELLTRHFGRAENLLYDELKQYKWDSTESTPIVIEYAYNWIPDKLGRRPAIFIVRGDIKRQKFAIGNRLLTANPNVINGIQMWIGSLGVNCLAPNPIIAELLADEVARFLSHFSPIIISCTKLSTFEVQGISQVQVAEEFKPNFFVSIPVSFSYQDEWQLVADEESLNDIQKQVTEAVHARWLPKFIPDESPK